MRGFIRAAAAALLLCAVIPLAACANHAAGQAQLSAVQIAQRSMLAAETAFNVAATAELDAKATGLLKGADAEKADAIRKQAYTALLGLRAVYAADQAPDITSLLLLTNQLLTLAGKAPVPTAIPTNVPTL